jgi:translation initiation factor 2D
LLTKRSVEADANLRLALLQVLGSVIVDADLPISASIFYSDYLIPNRPINTIVDIRKSSFRKLTKFLKHYEKAGLLKTKERSGVLYVTEIQRNHPELTSYTPHQTVRNSEEPSIGNSSLPLVEDRPKHTRTMRLLYRFPSNANLLFSSSGIS